MPHLPWILPQHPIDYSYLMDLLKSYQSPRDKISRMIMKKEIIPVKKGLYVLSPEFGKPIDLKVVANLIYGPSYISLEYALSYWGLIPEKVEEVTSITNKSSSLLLFHFFFLRSPFSRAEARRNILRLYSIRGNSCNSWAFFSSLLLFPQRGKFFPR